MGKYDDALEFMWGMMGTVYTCAAYAPSQSTMGSLEDDILSTREIFEEQKVEFDLLSKHPAIIKDDDAIRTIAVCFSGFVKNYLEIQRLAKLVELNKEVTQVDHGSYLVHRAAGIGDYGMIRSVLSEIFDLDYGQLLREQRAT